MMNDYNKILKHYGFKLSDRASRLFSIYQFEPPRVRSKDKKYNTFIPFSYGNVQVDLMHAEKYGDRRYRFIAVFVEALSKKVFLFPSKSKHSDAWYKAIMAALRFYGSK